MSTLGDGLRIYITSSPTETEGIHRHVAANTTLNSCVVQLSNCLSELLSRSALTLVPDSLQIVLQTLDLQDVETELLGVTLDTNIKLVDVVVGTCPTPSQILVSRLTLVTELDGDIVVNVSTRGLYQLGTELVVESEVTVHVLVNGSVDGTSIGSISLVVTELCACRPVHLLILVNQLTLYRELTSLTGSTVVGNQHVSLHTRKSHHTGHVVPSAVDLNTGNQLRESLLEPLLQLVAANLEQIYAIYGVVQLLTESGYTTLKVTILVLQIRQTTLQSSDLGGLFNSYILVCVLTRNE